MFKVRKTILFSKIPRMTSRFMQAKKEQANNKTGDLAVLLNSLLRQKRVRSYA